MEAFFFSFEEYNDKKRRRWQKRSEKLSGWVMKSDSWIDKFDGLKVIFKFLKNPLLWKRQANYVMFAYWKKVRKYEQ